MDDFLVYVLASNPTDDQIIRKKKEKVRNNSQCKKLHVKIVMIHL